MTDNKLNIKQMVCAVAATFVVSTSVQAAIPAGYYNSVNMSSSTAMHQSLHEIIDDHIRFPYTASTTDTWDILEQADTDPDNTNNVIDIYKNASYPKQGGGNTMYNREHSWPKSYGFPVDGSDNYPYTDTHHLFIADSGYNSSRSNKPYDFCSSACTEKLTDFNNNRGGSSSDSNWTEGSFTAGTWETWRGRRGDVARALMYMAVRYEGGTHGITGIAEPDLRLTDDRALIEQSNTGSNKTVAYMGLKSVLLQWHIEDPVDDFERRHNDAVYSHQGNRNPFIDHPEYVACVFQNTCSGGGTGDTTPPAAPTNLSATGGAGFVELAWTANNEADLSGYNVYRRSTPNGVFTKVNTTTVTTSAYTDNSVAAGSTYYYVISAIDTSFNESGYSAQATATTDGSTGGGGSNPGTAWINEFHYDNDGTDTGEFVEIAGGAGTDLTGWKIVGYNGNGGSSYKTVTLSGVIADQANGYGTLQFAFTSMQNGSPDGLALVDASGAVVQFISYEGVLTAVDGEASGMTSEDVGVAEATTTPVGYSLQLAGTGSSYSDFVWQAAAANTAGQPNNGQSFAGGGTVDTTPPEVPMGLMATGGNQEVVLTWSANTESDFAGYNLYRRNDGAATYTKLNTALLTATSYTDAGLTDSTTYHYAISSVDSNDNESAMSADASATTNTPVVGGDVWINEFHYDNKGGDTNEFVEIAGSAGVDLTGWKLLGYNGSDGSVYKTVSLSGSIVNQSNGFGTASFAFAGMQNGAPDGIALVNAAGEVVQFLSYEGTLTATSGAAAGMISENIGVSETSGTAVGDSLQLSGSGRTYADFIWQNPASSTSGQLNNGQSFN